MRHPITLKTKEDFNLEYKDATFPWPSLMRYCTLLIRVASRRTDCTHAGFSKLLVCLQVAEWQRRFDEEGVPIIVLSTHPGAVNTGTTPLHPSIFTHSPTDTFVLLHSQTAHKSGSPH